jgi:predicted acetyltransferase
VIHLPEASLLVPPTVTVRTSYLVGEQADCLLEGTPTEWPGPTSENFTGYLAERRGWTRDGGPSTVFWYVSGEYYLGTLVIRHRLTPAVAEAGGHVGTTWWRRGVGRV